MHELTRCLRQVGEGDFFWDANGRNQFPKVAEDVDAQLTQYKQVLLIPFLIMATKMLSSRWNPRQRSCSFGELCCQVMHTQVFSWPNRDCCFEAAARLRPGCG